MRAFLALLATIVMAALAVGALYLAFTNFLLLTYIVLWVGVGYVGYHILRAVFWKNYASINYLWPKKSKPREGDEF